MNNEERLDYVIGQGAAINALLIALIDTHPDPAKLVTQLERAVEIATAKTLPTAASEPMIEGLENTARSLKAAAAIAAKRQENRRTD